MLPPLSLCVVDVAAVSFDVVCCRSCCPCRRRRCCCYCGAVVCATSAAVVAAATVVCLTFSRYGCCSCRLHLRRTCRRLRQRRHRRRAGGRGGEGRRIATAAGIGRAPPPVGAMIGQAPRRPCCRRGRAGDSSIVTCDVCWEFYVARPSRR